LVRIITIGCFIVAGLLSQNEALAYTTVANPPLSQPCNVALVIDSSGSIGDNMNIYQNAFISFVDALSGKNTQFSVTDFDVMGRVLQPFTTNEDAVKAAIKRVEARGSTNWEDGLEKGRSTFPVTTERPNLVIFASDGGANTANGPGTPVSRAVDVANALKSNNKARILAIGITDNGGPQIINLSAISGPNVDTGDISTSYYF